MSGAGERGSSMTPLGAAKALAVMDEPLVTTEDSGFPDGYVVTYAICGGRQYPGDYDDVGHAPDCLWLQMPQIVAALEAAQVYVAAYAAWDAGVAEKNSVGFHDPPYAGPPILMLSAQERAAYGALVAAIKGTV